MAYDQNAPYQPPRRPYYGQTQPEAPVQPSYENYQDRQYFEHGQQQDHHQQQYGDYNDHDHYNDHGGYNQRPYDGQGRVDNESYQNAYNQRGYQEQWQESRDGYQPRERGYDPRYQSRGPRGTAGEGFPDAPRSKPPPERQGYQIQPSNRPTRSEHSSRMDDARGQYGRPVPDSRMNDYGDQRRAPQQGQARGKDYTNNPAADWRATEKAKMQAAAVSPNYLPQDTAFPKLGNKTDRPGTSEGRSSGRSSEDKRRPGSGRPDGQSQRSAEFWERPSGRERTSDGYPSQKSRPSTANAASKGHRGPAKQVQEDPDYRQRTSASQQASEYTNHSTNDHRSQGQQWPLGNYQAPTTSRPDKQNPIQFNGYSSMTEEIPRAQSTRPDNGLAQPSYHQQGQDLRQRSARTLPAVQPINTGNQSSRPDFMGYPSMGPVDVIKRPATASGARSVPVHQVASAISHQPQSATVESYASPKPWMQHTHSGSLDDVYDGYGATSNSNPDLPKSREEEIEEEMPDFGNTVVDQASSLHKRNKTVDRHLDDHPAASSHPPIPAVPSQYNNYRDQGHRQQYETALQPNSDFPGARLQQSHSNPEYPRDGTVPPKAQYAREGNRREPAREGYDGPFSHPGRSQTMDEKRQIPYRPSQPSNQRFYQQEPPRDNAQSALSQARPELDRAGTGQSTWSDPGQQRAPSAPPGGRGRPQPPNVGRAIRSHDQTVDPGQPRSSDPDALPHHPAPVRPGLLDQGQSHPAKPPPVRSYTNVDRNAPTATSQGQRTQNPDDPFAHPVTKEELGRLRAEVEANPNNPKRALIFAKKLIEAATVLANEGGRLDQKATAKNRERYIMEGHKRVKKLVNSGYPEAQFYLADCYGQGMLGLEVDTKEAFNLYQAAAKQGHGQAAYRTAVCCEMGPEEGGGTRRDYPKAVQWYRRAAALGDSAAMFKLGAVLLKGLLGQQRNVGEAVTWLKRAAERADNDNPHALHELASLYESSNADPEVRNKIIADDTYARDLYQRAAKLGYKFSQFRLGQAFEYGALGLPIDNRQSITWYTKAAAQGEHHAELALSGWYLTGAEGILEHSDTEAYLWARKAAMSEPPLAKALFAMGYFTEEGIGCPASLEEARKWYGRAASQKFPKALERLEALKKSGGKKPAPANGRITRKDQKRDESECMIM